MIQIKKLGRPRQMPPEANGPANLPFPAHHKTAKCQQLSHFGNEDPDLQTRATVAQKTIPMFGYFSKTEF